VTVTGGDNVVFGDEAKLTYDAGGVLVEAVSITMDQGAPPINHHRRRPRPDCGRLWG